MADAPVARSRPSARRTAVAPHPAGRRPRAAILPTGPQRSARPASA